VGGVVGLGVSIAGLSLTAGCSPPNRKAWGNSARVGIATGELVANWRYFVDGMRDLGWVEGQNLAFEILISEPPGHSEQVPQMELELIRRNVDVIVASTTAQAQAARSASRTVPIVTTGAVDPLGSGLIESLARPGGNVTGISILSSALRPKRLEILKEAIPTLASVVLLWNSGNPTNASGVAAVSEAAARLGVGVYSMDVTTPEADLQAALEAAAPAGADGLCLIDDGLLITSLTRPRIVEPTAAARMPAMYFERQFVESGGLMAYGPRFSACWYRAAHFVDRLLAGASPADLPIEQPTAFDLVVNPQTAAALGITLPPDVASQVTEWLP
jgi:putative ABC transport system substrate-binding protein